MIKSVTAAALSVFLLFPTVVCAQPSEPQTTIFPVSAQTWQYLDENPPGSYSIIAYSLGGHEIPDSTRHALTGSVDVAISEGFSNAKQLSQAVINLSKLGQDPLNYKKHNLFSALSTHSNIYEDGLDGALLTLMAYQSVESIVPESARNSIPAVIDYIVSTQQRSGGFALTAGRDPDPRVTAQVILALAPHRDIPYVSASLEKAIDWLGTRQNSDGTFPAQDLSSCETTATVIAALRVYGVSLEDSRFIKNARNLLDGLDLFENTDGGYASTIGEPSSVTATELAVIALQTNASGLSPFLPLTHYPDYVAPEDDPVTVYLRFFLGFLVMLAIVYGLLILTTKIGKKWGGLPPATTEEPEDETLTINIPMKAEVPDFDAILAQEQTTRDSKKNDQ